MIATAAKRPALTLTLLAVLAAVVWASTTFGFLPTITVIAVAATVAVFALLIVGSVSG